MKKILSFLLLLVAVAGFAQEMDFESYNPKSTLVVPENIITQAKYPFVDVHSHQWNLTKDKIARLVEEMDSLNMQVMVNLSGRGFSRETRDIGTQEYLNGMIRRTQGEAPGRFIIFTNVSFKNVGAAGWAEEAVKQLEEDVKNGASGLKIYKSLGLSYNDVDGNRIAVDDERLDPVWAKCGELGIPVLIHSADPASFWDPHDADNERWLELKLRPGRKRSATDPAPFEQIIGEQHNIFKKHRKTTFINAHMGWMANDLDKLGKHLDANPNVYVGIGAVIAELGRQPKQANAFFEKYQDRVLFAKDAYNQEEFYTYFRVLETEDEYFPYYKKYHAFWSMYGLGLSDEVLKKLYYKNALKIIPNIDKSGFPD
ncbi:MAG: amidohydrolase [Cyclobacteriaceae bacterium]